MGPARVGHSNRQMCFCKKGFRRGDCDLSCERIAVEDAAEYELGRTPESLCEEIHRISDWGWIRWSVLVRVLRGF